MRSLKECTTSYLWDLYNNNKQTILSDKNDNILLIDKEIDI